MNRPGDASPGRGTTEEAGEAETDRTSAPGESDSVTLYYLDAPDSLDGLEADAERRAEERGCTCGPAFVHVVDPAAGEMVVYVLHEDGCALLGGEP